MRMRTIMKVKASGTSVVEAVLVLVLGVMVLMVGMRFLGFTRRAEATQTTSANLAGQAVLAHGWLVRDLERLGPEGARPAVEVRAAPGGRRGSAMRLAVAAVDSSAQASVDYVFDAATGILERTGDGPARRFQLGTCGEVTFLRVDPSFAGGGPSRRGAYNNRVVYRITARDRKSSSEAFTLVGAQPLTVKASGDTFPFWNSRS